MSGRQEMTVGESAVMSESQDAKAEQDAAVYQLYDEIRQVSHSLSYLAEGQLSANLRRTC